MVYSPRRAFKRNSNRQTHQPSTHKLEQKLEHLQEQAQDNPDNPKTLIKIARVEKDLGRLNDAKNTLHTALRQDPNNVHTLRFLADLSGRLKDFGSKVVFAETALKKSPSHEVKHGTFELVIAYSQNGQHEQAQQLNQVLSKKYPDDIKITALLCQTQSLAGNKIAALAIYSALHDYTSLNKQVENLPNTLKQCFGDNVLDTLNLTTPTP